MKILTLKMRIVVLWIFAAVSITAESALFLYEKGWIEKVRKQGTLRITDNTECPYCNPMHSQKGESYDLSNMER